MANETLKKNNVRVFGRGERAIVFAHGFGCDQNMWRYVAPAFEKDFKVVLFDHVGHGKSDLAAFDKGRYATLDGYAADVRQICAELGLKDAVYVGHSVSATIGLLATLGEPNYFERMVLVGPSPCYINDGTYVGGFNRADIEGLLEFLESNHLGWSSQMAPVIMGNADRPELAAELTNSFCRTDPEIARHFARVTFMSDNRADLPRVRTKALILQCAEDLIAPRCVGEYVNQHLANSAIIYMKATGHCPNLSASAETIAAIRQFLET